MPPFGFCGGSSPAISPLADSQRTVNMYTEINEASGFDGKQSLYPTPKGKSRKSLLPAPGLKVFATLPGGRPRAQIHVENAGVERLFAIGGEKLYEIDKNGTPTLRSGASVLVDDGLPGSMAVSQIELCVCAGGLVFILNLATNVFTAIPQSSFSGGLVSMVGFADSYFIALLTNSAKFQISGLLHGLTWAGADIFQVEKFPDKIMTMIIDHGEIMLGGATKSTAYQSSTDPNSPFAVNLAAQIIECGVAAAFSPVRLDNSVFWLGQDERGGIIAYRLQGYIPMRTSTHSVEHQWNSYSRVDDAVAYAWQLEGHAFWQIYFPSATRNSAGELTNGTTWVYDVSNGDWWEREFVDSHGNRSAHRSWNHQFAFGKHLVGDWNDNKIYEMALPKLNGTTWDFADDFGNAIIRTRVGPHIAGEGQWISHNCVRYDVQVGLGPQPALTDTTGADRDPQLMHWWSDDSSKSYHGPRIAGLGKAGKYLTQVNFRQLGQSRDRVYKMTYSDPPPLRIIEVYFNPPGV